MGESRATTEFEKCPTGIRGLDEVTGGGLPRGRPTLVCGSAGSGKTLLAMEFIVRGIRDFGEPGVFMAFEETAEELATNVASFGFDLAALIRRKQLMVDYVYVERSEIEETGEYDLEGLFVRLDSMIREIGAKRVVLDSVEALFAGLANEAILRAELRRLFRWLKEKGVTAIITAEQGRNTLTRHGLEEYVSDCVISLNHRVTNRVATRRLRVVKYRGSSHGTNEYPTLIDESGLSILPITSLGLTYPVSKARVSTGITRLDAMMGGKGYFRGSSVLISGTAGSGKTSMAVAFVDAMCRQGRKCMYFSFEESPSQITRNMQSIGFDLSRWTKKGLLQFHSVRPSLFGLEMHLASMHKLVRDFAPDGVVMDPVTNLTVIGDTDEVKEMLTRVIDFLKSEQITAVFTSLSGAGSHLQLEQSEIGISSLMDTWLLLRMVESASERNRILYVLKSRGMAHSNQMREILLTDHGIALVDVYTGPGTVYTGSARLLQESADREQASVREAAGLRRRRELEQERLALEAQLQGLQSRLDGIAEETRVSAAQEKAQLRTATVARRTLAKARKADRGARGGEP